MERKIEVKSQKPKRPTPPMRKAKRDRPSGKPPVPTPPPPKKK